MRRAERVALHAAWWLNWLMDPRAAAVDPCGGCGRLFFCRCEP